MKTMDELEKRQLSDQELEDFLLDYADEIQRLQDQNSSVNDDEFCKEVSGLYAIMAGAENIKQQYYRKQFSV